MTNDGGRKDDLDFMQHRPRRIMDPAKDQSMSSSTTGSSHVEPRARKALVVTFDTSRARGRTPTVLISPPIVSCVIFGLVQDSTQA